MHNRINIRLRSHNYSSPGKYFITICTQKKEFYFGEIIDGKLHPSEIGRMAEILWKKIPEHFPNVRLDDYIIMPNHLHGIIEICSVQNCSDVGYVCWDVACNVPTNHTVVACNNRTIPSDSTTNKNESMSSISPKPGSVSAIIRSYKSAVTKWCNENHYLYFAWQPRFYDRIIRTRDEYFRIQKYIRNNPVKWEQDENFSQPYSRNNPKRFEN